MKEVYDIAVVGAGPAGMAAATVADEHGARVLLLDEQPGAGGQIYRGIARPALDDQSVLGADYYQGRQLLTGLQASGVDYFAGACVWQVSPQREIGVSWNGAARLLRAAQVILATGAQERPFPIPGWTLPGVMLAGGAQALLKSAGLAARNAVFAGSGPLLYLIAHQYLRAGIPIGAILDTTPVTNVPRALSRLPAALLHPADLLTGWRWIAQLRKAGVPVIRGVEDLRVCGKSEATGIEYRQRGSWRRIDTRRVFLHQGVVPNINLAMAAGCRHRWSAGQLCWEAVTDAWGETDAPGIAIAGDGAGIKGARAAACLGRIAGYGALARCGRIDKARCAELAAAPRLMLARELRPRPFLDALFRPARRFRIPRDGATIVCRCEEVNAARIRESMALGADDPNRLKGDTRCGMGPCQGRFCGLTVSEMMAEFRGVEAAQIGPLRLRAPVKPLPLAELAALQAHPHSTARGG